MRHDPHALMLFAAGLGTRMGALTADRPKPMIAVAGRPLIDHALAQAEGAPVEKIVANLHYKPEALQAHLEPKGVHCRIEAPEILETGGGLRAALPDLGAGPVFTLNTDAVWAGPAALALLAAAWAPDRMDALLLTVPATRAHGHKGTGDFTTDGAGRLSRGAGEVYTGAQIVRTDRLAEIGEAAFSLNRLWDLMLAEGRVFGLSYPGHWCDVGRPDGIAEAEAMLAAEPRA